MIRLLISLYLVVFVSIVLINQSSEMIWNSWVHQAPDELRHAQLVAKVLQESVSDIHQLPPHVTTLSSDDVAWLPEQIAALQQGGVITTFTEQGDALLTFQINGEESLAQLGPFLPASNALAQKYLFKLLSFVVLGLLLVFWLRPLWLDLMQFKRVTAQLAQGQLDISIQPSKFSAISNLTSQFHAMATKVANLMSDQKQLVNAVSHELRTPLARLKFALAMLAAKDPKEVQAMSQDVQEMELLIDEMLGYARLEIAAESLEYHAFDFSTLVHGQIEKLQRTNTKELNVTLCPNVTIYASQHYIARVVQNLLQNACKYGQSKVHVTLRVSHEEVELQVEDDGAGIKPEDRDKVFSPFVRVDHSRNKALGGFGLGLAIVQKILNWHNGRCEVSTSSLGGARFVMYLPISEKVKLLKVTP
ncbi:two-component sensor histidine kinase [Pseudoalteromonas aurantia]|uniref:histidine kinase n=1 Tax=Pseudoalteromonas aurantia TaxID=43654 RepID=A0A5S3V161_9GAMM|nr:ATP-binding protein [Pseudoalteromonas aurantia]TMO63041.1 two-component sensor histidine kinase [Pseudoalteromonas aurantia]TMO63522.1 two-component sensor histidine kinase [Pseudoalteromonas aurantia]